MYKATFKRDVYTQVPKAFAYYNRPLSSAMMRLEVDLFVKEFVNEDNRLREHIIQMISSINDTHSDREPIVEEEVFEDFLHLLKVGDIINVFGENTSVKKVVFNNDNSVEYQVGARMVNHDDYDNLKSIEVEKLENFNDVINNIFNTPKPEPAKKKSFLSRLFS